MTKALGVCEDPVLDVVRLEASLTKWVFSKLEDFQVLKTQHIANGKELCGSKDTGFRTLRWSHELGVVLAQSAVSGKTNEIPISTQLLKTFGRWESCDN